MDEKKIDIRGRPCPQPVTETIKTMNSDPARKKLIVVCDNKGQSENVRRAATRLGADAEIIQPNPTDYHVIIERQTATDDAQQQRERRAAEGHVAVLINNSTFGHGDEDLGRILMRSFVKTLKDAPTSPAWLILMNAGVHLVCQGSDLLDDFRTLREQGVMIMACGTCLDYYKLSDKLEVGEVTNMFDVVSILTAADNVVRP